MRLFGSDRIARWMDKSGAEEGEVITGGLVTRAIEQAQKRVELQNFQSRKRLLEYDDVMNQQREVVYSLRLFALERGEELKAEARRMIEAALERATTPVPRRARTRPEEYDRGGLREALMLQYLVTPDDAHRRRGDADAGRRWSKAAKAEGEAAFQRKVEYLPDFGQTIGIADVDSQVLSQVMLSVLDEKWKDHLYDLDQLRNAIQYRAWGQKDPLVEYKKEAFEMFEDLMHDIQSTFTERFLKIQVSAEPPRQEPPRRPPSGSRAQRADGDRGSGARAGRIGRPLHGAAPPRRAAAAAGRSCARRRAGVSSSLGPVGRPAPRPSPKWAGTIPVPAGRARSTRSATGRGASLVPHPGARRDAGIDFPPQSPSSRSRAARPADIRLRHERSASIQEDADTAQGG